MTDKQTTQPQAKFDPTKLEQLNVAKDYPMEPEEFRKLFEYNCYCEMAHINKKGFPIVTPMFYVVMDGFLYMSSIQKYRHKVHDLEENPKMSVSIHNDGANLRRQKAILLIGTEKWPFPIQIVKKGDTWLFDTEAGREEILNRRIGRNELLAIKACRAYVEAQQEYYNMPEPDGDQIPKYAQHMISSPGRRDGLYWPTAAGEKESPLGPLVAKAKEEGYMQKRKAGEKGPRPFHGYYFRILKRQGPSAAGGKFDYIINGNMVAGHAMVAYPARWGVSGVMTFIVNQRGRVYQKNLGPKTAEIARKMKEYNPDQTWKLTGE